MSETNGLETHENRKVNLSQNHSQSSMDTFCILLWSHTYRKENRNWKENRWVQCGQTVILLCTVGEGLWWDWLSYGHALPLVPMISRCIFRLVTSMSSFPIYSTLSSVYMWRLRVHQRVMQTMTQQWFPWYQVEVFTLDICISENGFGTHSLRLRLH